MAPLTVLGQTGGLRNDLLMQKITNEASMLLKTKEGKFTFALKRTQDTAPLNVKCAI